MMRASLLVMLVASCAIGYLSAVPIQQGSNYDEEIVVVPSPSDEATETNPELVVEEPAFSGDGSGYEAMEIRADMPTEASGEQIKESVSPMVDPIAEPLIEASGMEKPCDESESSGVVDPAYERADFHESSGEYSVEKSVESSVESSGWIDAEHERADFVESSGEHWIESSGESSGMVDPAYERSDFEESSGEHWVESSGEAVSEEQEVLLYESYGEEESTVSRARRSVDNETVSTTKASPAATILTSTTTVASVSSTTESEENKCKPHISCFNDSECGGKGRCLGIFVGKCNCNACINLLTCEDDKACGGLSGACNATTQRCNCIEGYQANGFPKFIDALRSLCNVKDCGRDTDTCFGLPCNSGRCIC